MDLYYKPRRDRKKAATLLAAEINLNSELLILLAHFRKARPRQIGRDFSMSTSAWQIAAPLLAELPAQLVKKALLLYSRYDLLNKIVLLYAEAVGELQALDPSSPRVAKLQAYTNSVVDVFHTTADSAFDDAKELLPLLIDLAKIPKKLRKEPKDDYEDRVKRMVAERGQRLGGLADMDDDPPAPST